MLHRCKEEKHIISSEVSTLLGNLNYEFNQLKAIARNPPTQYQQGLRAIGINKMKYTVSRITNISKLFPEIENQNCLLPVVEYEPQIDTDITELASDIANQDEDLDLNWG